MLLTNPSTARRVVAVSAWTILGFVIITPIATLPAVVAASQAAAPGSAMFMASRILLRLGWVAALTLWFSAIWFEAIDQHQRVAPKALILAVLVFGNFVAGFCYYFLFVLWIKPTAPPLKDDVRREA